MLSSPFSNNTKLYSNWLQSTTLKINLKEKKPFLFTNNILFTLCNFCRWSTSTVIWRRWTARRTTLSSVFARCCVTFRTRITSPPITTILDNTPRFRRSFLYVATIGTERSSGTNRTRTTSTITSWILLFFHTLRNHTFLMVQLWKQIWNVNGKLDLNTTWPWRTDVKKQRPGMLVFIFLILQQNDVDE